LVAWSQHCVPALGALGLVLGLFELCAVAAALAPMTSEAERRSVRPNMSIILFLLLPACRRREINVRLSMDVPRPRKGIFQVSDLRLSQG
jgi:hypothetical protein